ncbi:MAG: retropepsin-like aspartic protease, partial [Cyanobacteria bacterium J06598_3]
MLWVRRGWSFQAELPAGAPSAKGYQPPAPVLFMLWTGGALDGGLPPCPDRNRRTLFNGRKGRWNRARHSTRQVGKREPADTKGQVSASGPSGSRITASVVEVQVGNRSVWALVDSGADFTMMRGSLHAEIQRHLGGKLTVPSQTARGAGREPLKILGIAHDVTVSIQGREFVCSSVAVVDGLVYDVVLGRDFCCRHGTVIDDREGVLRVQGLAIPLPLYSDFKPSRSRVILAATAVVPPRSVMGVRAKVVPVDREFSNPYGVEGVVEPSLKAWKEDLLVPREVVTVDGRLSESGVDNPQADNLSSCEEVGVVSVLTTLITT